MQNIKFKIQNNIGQAALTAVILLLFILLALIGGFTGFSVKELSAANQIMNSKKSYILAEAGIEDAVYRLKTGKNTPSEIVINLDGFSVTTSVTVAGSARDIISTATAVRAVRKVKATLVQSQNISFNYGVQIGQGGLEMYSQSIVYGNAYSNGNIVGYGSSEIQGDAYAVGTISGSLTISGSRNPGSPPKSLPAIDLNYWKAQANQNNNPIIGNYELNSGASSLGPRKIQGNLTLNGNAQLTVNGPIYVTGNLEMNTNSEMYLNESFGSTGTVIIVDGRIGFNSNSIVYPTNANPKGYILFVSTKTGDAIELNSNISVGAVYALNGEVDVNSNAIATSIAGYKVVLNSNAEMTYDSSLSNARFSSGPASGWQIDKWNEI